PGGPPPPRPGGPYPGQAPSGAERGHPAPAWGPPYRTPGYGGPHPALAEIEERAQTALIIAAVGWFVGLMFICGPVAWVMAHKLKRRCFELGIPAPSKVQNAYLAGLITSILSLLGAMVLLGIAIAVSIGILAAF
ncbi:MAG: hypothetical protein AAGA56_07965, partial [Myxococcota bacterium]